MEGDNADIMRFAFSKTIDRISYYRFLEKMKKIYF